MNALVEYCAIASAGCMMPAIVFADTTESVKALDQVDVGVEVSGTVKVVPSSIRIHGTGKKAKPYLL